MALVYVSLCAINTVIFKKRERERSLLLQYRQQLFYRSCAQQDFGCKISNIYRDAVQLSPFWIKWTVWYIDQSEKQQHEYMLKLCWHQNKDVFLVLFFFPHGNVNKSQEIQGHLISFTEQILTQLYVEVVVLIILTTLSFCPKLQTCRSQESHNKIAYKSKSVRIM